MCVFGGAPNAALQPQKIFVFVCSCVWISSPITDSNVVCGGFCTLICARSVAGQEYSHDTVSANSNEDPMRLTSRAALVLLLALVFAPAARAAHVTGVTVSGSPIVGNSTQAISVTISVAFEPNEN